MVEWRLSQPTMSSARISSSPSGDLRAHAGNAPILFDQIDRFRLHPQVERLITPTPICDKIEEIPLRHQRNEFAMNWQMLEMTDDHTVFADLQ